MFGGESDGDFAVHFTIEKETCIFSAIRLGKCSFAVIKVIEKITGIGRTVVKQHAAIPYPDSVFKFSRVDRVVFKTHDASAI